MTELHFTEEEFELILKFEIEDYEIFDASGMKKKEWKEAIQGTDYKVIANVSPCRDHGHKLRTRAGHCAVCNPRNLQHQERYYDSGEIYLAFSESRRLIKIGITKSIYKRIDSLNAQNYSGVNDWAIIFSKHLESGAYRIESEVHALLKPHKVDLSFSRSFDSFETSREVFDCDLRLGIDTIEQTIKKHEQWLDDFMKKHLRS